MKCICDIDKECRECNCPYWMSEEKRDEFQKLLTDNIKGVSLMPSGCSLTFETYYREKK
jgi:hypothetical protein